MDKALFTVSKNGKIKDALLKIEENTHGIVFVEDNGTLVGSLSDGDIRRAFLENTTVEDSIADIMHTNFSFLTETEKTWENVLKLLDTNIKVVPIVNDHNQLVDIVSDRNFNTFKHSKIMSKAKSPLRISFAGGGTDLTSYFYDHSGVVLNATITKYAYATLIKRLDSSISIISNDLGLREDAPHIDALTYNDTLDLIKAVIKMINPDFGFELHTFSDAPKGSGLGGSASLLCAVIGAFNQLQEIKYDSYEIAELAFQAERIELDMPGGWQDQYVTVFGGFNFMEFQSKENIIHPLRIADETLLELEDSLILCYTGQTHYAGQVHHDQKKEMKKEDIKSCAHFSKELAFEMKSRLLKNRLDDFGELLHKAWTTKKKFSSKITNSHLDTIYDFALENGALGGKLLGAGGGGYFIFYVPTLKKHHLIRTLSEKGYHSEPLRFDHRGLVTWTSKR